MKETPRFRMPVLTQERPKKLIFLGQKVWQELRILVRLAKPSEPTPHGPTVSELEAEERGRNGTPHFTPNRTPQEPGRRRSTL